MISETCDQSEGEAYWVQFVPLDTRTPEIEPHRPLDHQIMSIGPFEHHYAVLQLEWEMERRIRANKCLTWAWKRQGKTATLHAADGSLIATCTIKIERDLFGDES
jgi:hypothetical protein